MQNYNFHIGKRILGVRAHNYGEALVKAKLLAKKLGVDIRTMERSK